MKQVWGAFFPRFLSQVFPFSFSLFSFVLPFSFVLLFDFSLGGRSCDELHARRNWRFRSLLKKIVAKSPQLLQTIPTQEITQHTGGMVDSLRQRKVQPSILAAANWMKRDTCQASARLSLRPVVSGRHAEPGAVLKWTIFCWKHFTFEIHTKETLLADMA